MDLTIVGLCQHLNILVPVGLMVFHIVARPCGHSFVKPLDLSIDLREVNVCQEVLETQ